MQSISHTLNKKQLIPTGININSKPIGTTDSPKKTEKLYDNDHLYEQLGDLVNAKFRSWYMKMFYALGKQHVLQLASAARADGADPRRLFSAMLNKAYLAKVS